MSDETFDQLVQFFKVLGNDTRLRIVGLLANRDMTVTDLAAALGLREPTISEHLAMLRSLDVVTMRADGNFRVYSFNPKALHALSRDMFTRERFAALVEPPYHTTDAIEAKAIRGLFNGDRLVRWPSTRRSLLYVLRWLAGRFEEGRRYPEKEVNAIIGQHHEDFATLRRELVDFHFMTRENGVYWRLPTPDIEALLKTHPTAT
jgi:hypothetical protein